MDTIRPKYRHRHQVLVLKCYPGWHEKKGQEPKPKACELGQLLEYAVSQPSKLPKVGAFLQIRAARDVARSRLGNVQVTLQILTAVIARTLPDLPLYLGSVLNVLETALKSEEIDIVEGSLSLFETYCRHLNGSSLPTDRDVWQQHQSLLQLYIGFASRDLSLSISPELRSADARRWKNAGLRAISTAVGAESLGIDGGKQLGVIVPAVLANLSTNKTNFHAACQQEARTEGTESVDSAEDDSVGFTALPTPAFRTTLNAVKIEDDKTQALAIQCLRHTFTVRTGDVRDRLRLVTMLTLRYITDKDSPASTEGGTWMNSVMEAVTEWTPVQHRFVIPDTVVELLVQNSLGTARLRQQLMLVAVINGLLGTSIDLPGLNVIDILLEFTQLELRLLQSHGLQREASTKSVRDKAASQTANTSRPVRGDLLLQVRRCIGNLACRCHYAEQISDMVTILLARIKVYPGPQVESGVHLSPSDIARIAALKTVKNILHSANTGSMAGASRKRSPVGIAVWEGTQGLLKDENREVRLSYVDALSTWLALETTQKDLWLPQHRFCRTESVSQSSYPEVGVRVAKGVKPSNKTSSPFLFSLHVAIYDIIMHTPQIDADVLLLHFLLTNLIEVLGINAMRSSLPMVERLQRDLGSNEIFQNAKARVNARSLVYGYFWALSRQLGFETSPVGQEIHSKICQKQDRGQWLDKIRLPALSLDDIRAIGVCDTDMGLHRVTTNFFISNIPRADIVEQICRSYEKAVTVRVEKRRISKSTSKASAECKLPERIKYELLSDWKREIIISEMDKYRQDSPNGRLKATTRGPPRSRRTSPARQPTLKVAELKKALSGYRRASARHSRNQSPVGRPASLGMASIVTSMHSMHSRASSRCQSVLSNGDTPNDPVGPNDAPARSAAEQSSHRQRSDSVQSSSSISNSDPRLGNDVPPVPKIPQSIRLAGRSLSSSRDVSPMRPCNPSGFPRPALAKTVMVTPTITSAPTPASTPAPTPAPTTNAADLSGQIKISQPQPQSSFFLPGQKKRVPTNLVALLAGISVDGKGSQSQSQSPGGGGKQ